MWLQFMIVLTRLLNKPLPVLTNLPSTSTAGTVRGVVVPTKVVSRPYSATPPMANRMLAECLGTAFVMQVGCAGALMTQQAKLNAKIMAPISGLAVCTAVTALRGTSGAHLNPAVTLAFAANNFRTCAGEELVMQCSCYIAAQLAGATMAALLNAAVFAPDIAATQVLLPSLPLGLATLCEVGVSALLAFSIFAIVEGVPHDYVPSAVGTLVTAISMTFSNLGVGLNPAHAVGPRLVAALSFGGTAFRPEACLYVLGPVLGAVLGGAAYVQGSHHARALHERWGKGFSRLAVQPLRQPEPRYRSEEGQGNLGSLLLRAPTGLSLESASPLAYAR